MISKTYFRTERKGKIRNVLLEDLTDEELLEFCVRRNEEFALSVLRHLCDMVKSTHTQDEHREYTDEEEE